VKCGLHLVHDDCKEVVEPSTSQLVCLPSFQQAVKTDRNISAKKLTEVLKNTNGISVNKRKLYRAKDMVVKSIDEEFCKEFQKLDSWSELFSELNPGSTVHASWVAGVEGNVQFDSLYFLPKPMVQIAGTCAQKFLQIKTRLLQFPLVTCVAIFAEIVDGNLDCVPLAFGLYADASESSYVRFIQQLRRRAGLEAWVSDEGVTVLTAFDANARLAVLKELPKARHQWCFADVVRHLKSQSKGVGGLLSSMANVGESGKSQSEALLWAAQSAATATAHSHAMNRLRGILPEAYQFLVALEGGVASWAQYPSLEAGMKTYGHVFLDGQQSALSKTMQDTDTNRSVSLLAMLDEWGRTFMVAVSNGRAQGKQWTEMGQIVTGATALPLHEREFISKHYAVSPSDDDVCFVTCPVQNPGSSSVSEGGYCSECSGSGPGESNRQCRVDLSTFSCSCRLWQQVTTAYVHYHTPLTTYPF
jgi:hypothetical protein